VDPVLTQLHQSRRSFVHKSRPVVFGLLVCANFHLYRFITSLYVWGDEPQISLNFAFRHYDIVVTGGATLRGVEKFDKHHNYNYKPFSIHRRRFFKF